MNLFNFFRKRNMPTENPMIENTQEFPAVPKDVFIEEREPREIQSDMQSKPASAGIEQVYDFLQADLESKGYNDALTNPDESFKNDTLNQVRSELQLLISKVNTRYEDLIKTLDFHIESRGRSGLIDLVEELKFKKVVVLEHMNKMKDIVDDMNEGGILTQQIFLSYKRGFMRGLAAISKTIL